jgi:hypothetical protein
VTLEEALRDPHFAARGVFRRRLAGEKKSIVALPVPISDNFRAEEADLGYPALGEANELLGS